MFSLEVKRPYIEKNIENNYNQKRR